MNRQTVSGTILILLLISMLALTISIRQVKATGTIYIKPDGSVDPSTAPIEQDGAIYTFTDNIYESIAVERDNVIIDGDGYSLQGTGCGCGLDLSNRNNVTIKKIHINSFDYGIRLHNSLRNDIAENVITNINHYGVELRYSDGNNITDNNIASVYYFGIGLHYSDDNIIADNNVMDTINGTSILVGNSRCDKIYHNNFINNSIRQAYVYSSYRIVWDDGYPSGGNYWSDYEEAYPDAEEIDNSGIWDTPYFIDESNQDDYPLMEPYSPIPKTIDELVTEIEELGFEGEIDNQGIVTSLLPKLNVVQKLIDDGKIDQAKNILNAFINEVQAQSGKHITPDAAELLIESVECILSHL